VSQAGTPSVPTVGPASPTDKAARIDPHKQADEDPNDFFGTDDFYGRARVFTDQNDASEEAQESKP